ncbi:Acetolactate synthase large subunit [Planctomycetales bacterium 10988]|nr:Acetolactate synthase large subunit [Planctomycetales bacterium 10988]
MSGTLEQTTTKKAASLQSGADIVVQSLVNHGVEVVFAYPGGASMPMHQSLTRFKDKIRTVLPRHEQGGGFAAQGFTRCSGKISVCMATSGPGATNLVTAIADAKMDSVPMIAITGQVKTDVIGSDAFQETPIVEVCRSITKHHYLVTDVEDLARIMREAFHVATTGRPGPVLIDMPKDVQLAQTVPNYEAEMKLPGYKVETKHADPRQIAQIASAISMAKRPIVYAGGGIIAGNASAELQEFVDKTGIPITTTLMGLGCYPTDAELSLRMLGMHGTVYANYAISEADLVLALGVRFDDRVTGKLSEFLKNAKIVHIDVDASEINKNKIAHFPVVSEVKSALADLNKVVEAPEDLSEWHAQIKQWKENEPLRYNQDYEGILPQYACAELSRITKEMNPIIAVGVGQHQMFAAQYCEFRSPRSWLSSSGLGTMGFGLPAAMGAKLAYPDRLVVDIDGDGSYLMNIQEMATCHCEDIPVKVMLLNNQHLGMVVQWEDRFHAGNRAHTYLGPVDHPEAIGQGDGIGPDQRYPDFVALAKGFGWGASHVIKKSDFTAAVKEMIEYPGPYLLDVMVPYQEHVIPMIPSGGTVQDIIKS